MGNQNTPTTPTFETPVAQTPPVTNPQKPKSKFSLGTVIGIVIFLLLAGGAAAGYVYREPLMKLVSKPTPTPTVIQTLPTITPSSSPSAAASFEEDTSVPGQKKYVSPRLGVTFLYMPKPDQYTNDTASVKEDGDKIYIYMNQLAKVTQQGDYKSGQWIQVFDKDKSQTLADAIKQKFLTNYSEKDCFVTETLEQVKAKFPASFESAIISYPKPTGDQGLPFWTNADKCPQVYSETNGISYFLMDKNHPEKFAFLSVGQYVIYGSKTQGWQDTVEFLTESTSTPQPTQSLCNSDSDCPTGSTCITQGPLIANQPVKKVCSQPGTANPL